MDTIKSVAYPAYAGMTSVTPRHEVSHTPEDGGIQADTAEVAGLTGRGMDIGHQYQQRLAEKEAVNQAAQEARQISNGLKLVERARKEVELVVKSFPPFPPGSAEREQYLRSVAGIRTIIEQLTLTPENRRQLDALLGQGPMVNADLPIPTLAEGMAVLEQAGSILSDMGEERVKTLNDALPPVGGEGDFLGRSHDIGAALAGQPSGITREPPTVLRSFA